MLGYERTAHLQFLLQNKDREQVKILTGLRGGGKTDLIHRYMARLAADGVPGSRLFYIDLSAPASRIHFPQEELFRYLFDRFAGGERAYIFLDEAQCLPDVEKLTDRLFRFQNFDICLAGSDMAAALPRLQALLPGRCLIRQIYPLSFQETITVLQTPPTTETLIQYISASSMPGVWNEQDMRAQLDTIISAALFHEVCSGSTVRQGLLIKILTLLAERCGDLLLLKTISELTGRTGRPLLARTLQTYLRRLEECDLLLAVPYQPFADSPKEPEAYRFFFPDGAMMGLWASPDALPFRQIQNAVCAELFRRCGHVSTTGSAAAPIDFLTEGSTFRTLWQCIPDGSVPGAREKIAALSGAPDVYQKCILTFTPDRFERRPGILIQPLLPWFLQNGVK